MSETRSEDVIEQEQAKNQPQPALPRVWVLGGGITGLTAAHELAERGFKVFVVEREEDIRRPGDVEVGGMARTQWAYAPVRDDKVSDGIPSTIPMIALPEIRNIAFDPNNTEIDGTAKETIRNLVKRRDLHQFTVKVQGYYKVDSNGSRERVQRLGEVVCREMAQAIATANQATPKDPICIKPRIPEPSSASEEKVCLEIIADSVPGEHGFRFFHGFYRHVFDTMRRIQVRGPEQRSYADAYRTVRDNLSPSDGFRLDFEAVDNKSAARTVEFPRRHFRGLRQLHDTIQDFMRYAQHTAEDITRISLKIFKYMTSCTKRRAEQYEEMSWWEFIDGPSFSEHASKHYELAPQVLVGLTATKCDARTQGTVVTQMIVDQLIQGDRADATLNANTTDAWFKPWKDYLKTQGVEFRRAELIGFEADETNRYVAPVFSPSISPERSISDYFVLALSMQSLLVRSPSTGENLVKQFIEEYNKLDPNARSLNGVADFQALKKFGKEIGDWNGDRVNTSDESALRHMNGIQFYFPTDVPQKAGRSLYLDSTWRLSSLSQVEFWHKEPNATDGYRGILSVDIGAWHTPDIHTKKTAWISTKDEIAKSVWEQVHRTVALQGRGYNRKPLFYHIDDSLHFEPVDPTDPNRGDKLVRNNAPYLVSKPGDWKKRPGGNLDPKSGYEIQAKNWILAGTFMKSYTRLTSMESANESGRHAVNGILQAIDPECEQFPRCHIWDPEDRELPDLLWLRELDEKLYDYTSGAENESQRLPHFIDILGLDDMNEVLRFVDGEPAAQSMLIKLIAKTFNRGA